GFRRGEIVKAYSFPPPRQPAGGARREHASGACRALPAPTSFLKKAWQKLYYFFTHFPSRRNCKDYRFLPRVSMQAVLAIP
ncbi:MAG: hypothetical protein ACI4W6_05055, partial [Acutalibacteraceae bacterium]